MTSVSGDRLREAAEALRVIGERWARRAYELLPDGPERDEAQRDAMELAYSSSLREALSGDERGGMTWAQMSAEHVAVAKVIHDRAGDDDPHVFGRETASCDWLADQILEATNGGGGEGLADLARSACIGIHARDHGNEPLSFDECPVDYCADARARLAVAQPASHAAEGELDRIRREVRETFERQRSRLGHDLRLVWGEVADEYGMTEDGILGIVGEPRP